MRSVLDALEERVLISDGAMGTELYSRGIFLNRSFDELNLTQPDLVSEVHEAYVRAGADIIETNTFGANRVKLGAFGLASSLRTINLAGARLARQAARESAFVAGSIGPLGLRVEPWGKTGLDEAADDFREQASALAEGGVDLFMLETFRDVNELGAAVRAVRDVSDKPVVAFLTTGEDGHSLDGVPPEEFTPQLDAFGADLIGINCSVGPAAMLDTIERMAALTRRRLAAQPNAGRPREVDGRNIYLCSPEYMASYARRFTTAGVRLLGGCCGTTPEHIRQIRGSVRSLVPATERSARLVRRARLEPKDPVRAVPRREKSQLAGALDAGRFVVGVELAPPRGLEAATLIEGAREAKSRGVDFIFVPERVASGARMSALATALVVEQQAGVETLLQYSCRDHSLPGIQADLLGAHAMGLRNVLLVTGEPLKRGDYPDATLVFDVDSIGLTNVVSRLNAGEDIGGQPIGAATGFHIGVAINPTATNIDQEVRRFKYKRDAGAEFVVTHPIYDPADLEPFLARLDGARMPVIAAVRPLQSAREAELLANEVPGVRIPASVVERLAAAEEAGNAAAEGVAIARDVAERIHTLVQGLLVVSLKGRLEEACGLLGVITALRGQTVAVAPCPPGGSPGV
jgi:methionine synthase I (cobalamin-dependent)/5,10-methylenetetrahydrofolate reductase